MKPLRSFIPEKSPSVTLHFGGITYFSIFHENVHQLNVYRLGNCRRLGLNLNTWVWLCLFIEYRLTDYESMMEWQYMRGWQMIRCDEMRNIEYSRKRITMYLFFIVPEKETKMLILALSWPPSHKFEAKSYCVWLGTHSTYSVHRL